MLCRRDLGELTARTTYEMQDILDDPAVDTVVEVMGGLHPAYEYVAAALRAGKNVVSSNKYLMCRYYDELTALANEHGAALRCTAAVGGGIPWLTNLEKAAHANHISRVWGILNGTQGGHRPLSGARLHVQADRDGRAKKRQHPRLRRADAAWP